MGKSGTRESLVHSTLETFLGLFSLPSVPFFSEGLISYLVFSNHLWNSLSGFQLTSPRGFLEWFFRSTKMWCFVLINILLLRSVIWKLLSMSLTSPSSTSHTLSSCSAFYSDHSGLSCSCENIIYRVMYQDTHTHFHSISLENHPILQSRRWKLHDVTLKPSCCHSWLTVFCTDLSIALFYLSLWS